MIREHDTGILLEDLPDEGLRAGDVGTVVHIYADGRAYEVEFTTLTGVTIAVATVEASQLRPAASSDVRHTRPLAAV